MKQKISADTAFLYILVAVCAGINLFSLADYPLLHCDEAGNSTVAWQTITTGKQTFGFLGDQNDIRNELGGRLFLSMAGAWMVVFGQSYVVGRLLSIVGWLIAATLVYWNTQLLTQSKIAGNISAAVFATSLNVFWASHIIRQEI